MRGLGRHLRCRGSIAQPEQRRIRREGNHFDAKATNRAGKQVSLDVDAQTGAITPEKEGKDEERKHK